MADMATLSKEQLIERLVGRDTTLAAQETELHDNNIELQTQREKLREQDIALQSKDLTIAELEQEKQEWELAYNELVQRAFGKRSERYIHDPDQLRIDFGDTDEGADVVHAFDATVSLGTDYTRQRLLRDIFRGMRMAKGLERHELDTPVEGLELRLLERSVCSLLCHASASGWARSRRAQKAFLIRGAPLLQLL